MTGHPEAPRLYRDQHHRLLGGVAAGIANHLGAPRWVIRLGFLILSMPTGLGFILYASFWAVMPCPPGTPSRHFGLSRSIPFVALGAGVYLALYLSGTTFSNRTYLAGLVALTAVGSGVIWHNSDPKARERWSGARPEAPWLAMMTDNDRNGYILRFVGGGLLIVTGIIGTAAVLTPLTGVGVGSIVYGLVFALVALAGVGVALAPVFWRMFSQLRAEREARIREQERAEVAAMIHDQVLHTLALIQRNASDTSSVVRMARRQERTLRNWLYQSTASGTESFSAGLEEAAAEVEDTYDITVETVVVGDAAVDEHVAALIAAAREALVNAGKHAQVPSVSLYAEVEPDMLTVYVRDRGPGFDQNMINSDRHGVRGSIIARMKRHGGRAEIRTRIGEGTEVRLTMPVSADTRGRDEENQP